MKQIWKYPINLMHVANIVAMPKGGVILDVQLQDNVPTLWAMVDRDNEYEERTFYAFETGQTITNAECENYDYIGTVQQHSYVWHIFECKK